ncbi:hypothetical protein HZA33_05225 [Candidatus Pacearchaeota archaeon]|nr:hypothetical protein [Candidatus Pacearchaeota archaeon]
MPKNIESILEEIHPTYYWYKSPVYENFGYGSYSSIRIQLKYKKQGFPEIREGIIISSHAPYYFKMLIKKRNNKDKLEDVEYIKDISYSSVRKAWGIK